MVYVSFPLLRRVARVVLLVSLQCREKLYDVLSPFGAGTTCMVSLVVPVSVLFLTVRCADGIRVTLHALLVTRCFALGFASW